MGNGEHYAAADALHVNRPAMEPRSGGLQPRGDGLKPQSPGQLLAPQLLGSGTHGPRAPAASSSYLGISSSAVRSSSTACGGSSSRTCSSSSEHFVCCSTQFASSADILHYLKSHPDYAKAPPDCLDAIVAAVLSGLTLVAGVAIGITAGVGTAAVITSMCSSLLISAGTSGMINAVNGVAHGGGFDWGRWAAEMGQNAAVTIVTFGAGFGAGAAMTRTVMHLTTKMSAAGIKAAAAVAGALAGAGVQSGTYVVIRKVNGQPVEVLRVLMDAAGGAMAGACAGLQAARLALQDPPVWRAPRPEDPGNMSPEEIAQSYVDAVRSEYGDELWRFQADFDRQTVLEVLYHPELDRLSIIEGWHVGDLRGSHQGAGLQHILMEHPDVVRSIGVAPALLDGARQGIHADQVEVARQLARVMSGRPLGAVVPGRGQFGYVWELPNDRGHWLKVGLSKEVWAHGCRTVVQANLVRAGANNFVAWDVLTGTYPHLPHV